MPTPEEVTPERLRLIMDTMISTHIYWCPVGGHWGVTYRNGGLCHMGCNFPPWPGTVAHLPQEAQ